MNSDRDYEASLSREIDAWLRGDRSRRHVLAGLLGASGFAFTGKAVQAAVAQRFSGTPTDRLLEQAAVELASPDTPLGKARADAVKASTEGPKDESAFRGVEAAKQFRAPR
jgi:hypothetical protein